MDAATVGSNSIQPSRNMLEVAPQSLTPRTGKSTLSKSMGLPVYHWSSSGRLLSSHSQPRPEQKSSNYTDDQLPPGLSGGSSRVSAYASWGRNLSRLLAEVGSISPRHLQWRCAKNMQSWGFNCLFRRLKSSSSRQLPKGFRFLCSQRGRESCSSLCSNEFLSCCIIMFYLIRWYLDVSRSCFLSVAGLKHVSALIDVRLEPAGNARTEGYGRFVHVYMVVIKS